jgi:hypothetical protein
VLKCKENCYKITIEIKKTTSDVVDRKKGAEKQKARSIDIERAVAYN